MNESLHSDAPGAFIVEVVTSMIDHFVATLDPPILMVVVMVATLLMGIQSIVSVGPELPWIPTLHVRWRRVIVVGRIKDLILRIWERILWSQVTLRARYHRLVLTVTAGRREEPLSLKIRIPGAAGVNRSSFQVHWWELAVRWLSILLVNAMRSWILGRSTWMATWLV